MMSGALVNCAFMSQSSLWASGQLESKIQELLHQDMSNPNSPRQKPASAEDQISSRNSSIAFMLEDAGCFPPRTNLESVMEVFFTTTGLSCTAGHLSYFASILANDGKCPFDPHRVFFSSATVQECLSVMFSCGLGVLSGEWAFHVGIPACSSIGGAMIVVVPGVMGFGTFSPRCNVQRTSVRGFHFFNLLFKTSRFGHFHRYHIAPDMSLVFQRKRAKTKKTFATTHQRLCIQKLLWAAAQGDLCEIRRLRSEGVDLNAQDYNGRTALHLAAAEGKVKIVRYLLRHGARLEIQDGYGDAPTFYPITSTSSLTSSCSSNQHNPVEDPSQIKMHQYFKKFFRQRTHHRQFNDRGLARVGEWKKEHWKWFSAIQSLNVQLFIDNKVKNWATICDMEHRSLLHFAISRYCQAQDEDKAPILQVIHLFIEQCPILLYSEDDYGKTPLMLAQYHQAQARTTTNCLEIIQLLTSQMQLHAHLKTDVHAEEEEENDDDSGIALNRLLLECKKTRSFSHDSSDGMMLRKDDDMEQDDLEEEDIDFLLADPLEMSTHSASLFLSNNIAGYAMGEGEISATELLENLSNNGLQRDDPRLVSILAQIDQLTRLDVDAKLTPEQVRHVTESGALLIEKSRLGKLILPDFDSFCDEVRSYS